MTTLYLRETRRIVAMLALGCATIGPTSHARAQPAGAEAAKAGAPRPSAETERRERERINTDLIETADLIKKKEGELTAIETELGTLEKDEVKKKASLDARRVEIVSLMSALLRMGRNPPPVIFTERNDALKVVRSATLLSRAYPLLTRDAVGLNDELEKLATVMQTVRTKRDQLSRETNHLKEKHVRLSALKAEKLEALKAAQPELPAVKAAVAEASKASENPDQLIEQASKEVADRTGLGAYEREAKAKDGVDVAANAPIDELRPSGETPGADRLKPAMPFEAAKGRLPKPAEGRQVVGFDEKTQLGGQSKGIVIETRPGAQITSPCDGWIIYSSEFRSYGQLLIINAGDGYHVLLAGLSRVDVQPGQFVLAAEPVGTMSNAPARAGEKENRPVLYVEFRKNNRPENPDPWWVK